MIPNPYIVSPSIDLANLQHARSYWNARASDYDQDFVRAPIRSQTISSLVNQLAPLEGECFADIGVGSARPFTDHRARFQSASRLVGIDLADNMLEIARLRCAAFGLRQFEAKQGLFTELPLETGSMDGLLSSMAMHHVTDAQKILAVSEMRRVLKPGGRVVIVDQINNLGVSTDDLEFRREMVKTFYPHLPEETALERCEHVVEYSATPAFLFSVFSDAGFHVSIEVISPVVGLIFARRSS
jgi:putative AdoMet-dependent methyltransferase